MKMSRLCAHPVKPSTASSALAWTCLPSALISSTKLRTENVVAHQAYAMAARIKPELHISQVARFPGLRALSWDGNVLYASRGYDLLSAVADDNPIRWQTVARYSAPMWGNLTARSRLTFRLFRGGFHALAVLSSGHLIAAVPGAIVVRSPGSRYFRVSHKVLRGTRPLHIAVTPDDHIFWSEYFDNSHRDEVHIYASNDKGATWEIAYTFPCGAIRHVHNIVYDEWQDCLWVLTGDNGAECQILRASCDFKHVYAVASGKQQARAVALVPTREALYFSSDTPFETNHIYRYRDRKSTRLNSSHGSISYAVFCLKKKKFCSGRPANAIA